MSASSNWLNIIINPPQKESAKPGSSSQIQVIATNKKSAGILVKIYLELPNTLQQWCKHTRQSFNLNPHQSQEILFQWQIPPHALASTYNYALIVDSPRNFSSPLRYNRQIQILPPIDNPSQKTVDPTFWLLPDTSSTKPVQLQSGQSLTVQVFIHNRSPQVDQYRLECDLDDSWYTLNYPEGVAEPGLVRSNSQLNLLPNARGQIALILHPPKDTFAGNYRPDIRLHSSTKPNLFLKKIFYFDIPASYALQANLDTILNKVRRKSGKYQIELSNQGNTIREITIIAKTTDEDELCQYNLEQSTLRLAPGKTTNVALKVKPIKQQGRSFFKAKQYSFQVQIEDLNQEPLPKNLPLKESLFLKPRPWWHFILLLLLGGGIFASVIFALWFLLFRSSGNPEIIQFKSNHPSVEYNSKTSIYLNWKVKHPQKIEQITIYDQNQPNKQKCYQFNSKSINSRCILIDLQSPPENCNFIATEQILDCSVNARFIPTQKPGEYTFILKTKLSRQEAIEKEVKVIRNEKAITSINREKLVTNAQKYTPQQDIILKFEINNSEAVHKLYLLENGEIKQDITNDLREICQPIGNGKNLKCTINIGKKPDNKYTFGLKLIHDRKGYINPPEAQVIETAEIAVETPIKLERFAINNKTNSPINLKSDEKSVVSWNITGKGVRITITGIGETLTQNRGYRTLDPFPDGTSKDFTIKATDIYGRSIEPKTLTINVESSPPKPDINDLLPDLLEKLNESKSQN